MARVLIADDSHFMRTSLKKIIEDAGHTVVGLAPNGKEAVRLYQELTPDLVTLDIVMENHDQDLTRSEAGAVLDGLVALHNILALDSAAIVVMITALADKPTRDRAAALGAAGFIAKPIKPDDNFRGTLQKILDLRR